MLLAETPLLNCVLYSLIGVWSIVGIVHCLNLLLGNYREMD